MTAASERGLIRLLHLVLSIPILGYVYGPVATIPHAAWVTRWVAMPLVVLSGFWLWLKPRFVKLLNHQRRLRAVAVIAITGGLALLPCSDATSQSVALPLQVGDVFPPFSGQTLTAKTLTLPGAASGRASIVVFSFSRMAGKDGKAWNERLAKDFPDAMAIYTIIILESAPKMLRPMALSGIKSGMPNEMKDRTFVLYQGEKLWRQRLTVADDSRAYLLLLRPDGRIGWKNKGVFTETEYLQLKAEFASL